MNIHWFIEIGISVNKVKFSKKSYLYNGGWTLSSWVERCHMNMCGPLLHLGQDMTEKAYYVQTKIYKHIITV